MGNGILHDFVFDRPQPGESEAPSRQASKRIPNADRYFAAKFGMQENRGLKENKMKLTKQQLKHIIKEEIGKLLEFEGWESAYPDIPEEDLDTVPNMIYRFMKGGENVIDTNYTDWMQDARDPATLSLPENAEYIIAVIKDAFATQEKGRAREDKPGRLTGQIRLETNPNTDQPIISFRVEGVQLGPNPRNLHRGGLFNVVNSKNGGIEIIKR